MEKLVICEKYHKCKGKDSNGVFHCGHGEEHEITTRCFAYCECHYGSKVKINCIPIRALKLKQIKHKENDKRRR
jgi:hypothetical protein